LDKVEWGHQRQIPAYPTRPAQVRPRDSVRFNSLAEEEVAEVVVPEIRNRVDLTVEVQTAHYYSQAPLHPPRPLAWLHQEISQVRVSQGPVITGLVVAVVALKAPVVDRRQTQMEAVTAVLELPPQLPEPLDALQLAAVEV
jgi:hypothetical protein